jgi:hypothetical protein
MSYAILENMVFRRSLLQSSGALREVAINPNLAFESHRQGDIMGFD